MYYYFQIQFKRLYRLLKEEKLNPVYTIIAVAVFFLGLSQALFEYVSQAPLIYSVLALSSLSGLGTTDRNEFLKNTFTNPEFRIIRIIENGILVLPFAGFLLYNLEYVYVLGVVVASVVMSMSDRTYSVVWAIPTPFYKKPFEFIVGFRKSILALLLGLGLAILSIVVDNFNIGIFGILVTYFICLNFYSYSEPEFFVWIHAEKPASFIWGKIKTGLVHGFYIGLPLTALLAFFYFDKVYFILMFQFLGMIYIAVSTIAKYAYYPSEINTTQMVMLIISMLFPPLLIVLIPYLFSKSKHNLSHLLT
ncbi:MAG: hypothetical protein CL840_13725 [Crocinitomicaceae bacterium]|nr:hypothetical protein [Crocinitomicaceae bacterium]